jgi:polyphosphate kinase 2 (PPK2 family)
VDKEDWKNRDYYDAYQRAAIEMIRRTDATHAPWQVVPADHKDSARLLVLDAVCDQIERALDEK